MNFLRRFRTYLLKKNLLHLTNYTIAIAKVLRTESWIYESATVHFEDIEYLYCGNRGNLQTFTTGHSNRKLSMALSLQHHAMRPVKITQNKGHFAVQSHSRSPILLQIESLYTASYIKTIATQVLRIKSWIYESARNLYRGRRAVHLQTFTTRYSNRKFP